MDPVRGSLHALDLGHHHALQTIHWRLVHFSHVAIAISNK